MDLATLKTKVNGIEGRLNDKAFVLLHGFERDGRILQVALTARLRTRCRKARVWKSKAFLTALKNAEYGFDPKAPKSRGGKDGVFLLDKSFRPPNQMMGKLFDGYLDRRDSGVEIIAEDLGVSVPELLPVRLVSHHLRLLGVLKRGQNREDEDWLVLVDFDDTK